MQRLFATTVLVPILLGFAGSTGLAAAVSAQSARTDQAEAVAKKQIKVFGQPRRGHLQAVYGVDFSPDGKRALSCSQDGTIKIWNTANGKRVRTIRKHTGLIWNARFIETGKKIISFGFDRTARFFDAKNGKQLGKIDGMPKKFENYLMLRLDVQITPDGKELWFLDSDQKSYNKFLRIDLAGMKLLPPVLVGDKNHVRHFDFSSDGKRIALAQMKPNFKGCVSVFDREAGKVLYTEDSTRGSRIAFFADDAKYFLPGSRAMETRNAADGKVLGSLNGFSDNATGFAMTADGSKVYMGFFFDSNVLCVDLANKKIAFQYGEFLGSVNALALSPDGATLLAGGEDGAVRFLDAADGKEKFLPKWHQNRVQAVAVAKDGAHVVSGTFDNEVVIWNAKSGKVAHDVHDHEYSVIGAGFLPDGRALSASNDRTIKLYDPATGEVKQTLDPGEAASSMSAFAIAKNGKLAATGHAKGLVVVWDLATGTQKHSFQATKDGISALAIAPGRVAVGTNGRVDVFKIGEDKPMTTIPKVAPDKSKEEDSSSIEVSALSMLPWGRIAIGHAGGRLRIYKVGESTPKKDVRLQKDGSYISDLLVSPDNETLFVVFTDGVHSLDANEYEAFRDPIQAFDSGVMAIDVDAEGKYLFAAMTDGTVLRLQLDKWK